MIEQLPQDSEVVLGFKMSGKLHDEDYKKFVPLIDSAVAKQGKIRLLAQFEDFHGWDLHALWDDIKFATAHCLEHRTHRPGRRQGVGEVDGQGLQAVHHGQDQVFRRF